MTAYPNREHANADKNAREQAILALSILVNDAQTLQRRLANGTYVDVTDAQTLVTGGLEVTRRLVVLGTLRDVREWHEADQAEATEARP